MSVKSVINKITGSEDESNPATTAQKTEAKTSVPSIGTMSVATRINLQPILSEKSVKQQLHKQVAFRVSPQASKRDIAAAIMEVYKVPARRIRTIILHPKRRVRGRTIGSTRAWKKAYVTVDDIQAFNVAP